jgi:spore maturation protein CgeB
MSAGGLMFIKRTPDDHAEGGMLEIFEPFVHYVPFLEDDFHELADRYLNDQTARQTIIANAAKQVRAQHTWSHRAAKIIQDYRRVA